MVLVKEVLNIFPLYQCSLVLPPIIILTSIEILLRTFLWQGGKNKGGKKFALVSWKNIKLPQMEGGLQIKDVKYWNLAMGEKLLWNLLEAKPSWSS